jgi:hypothetical protein
MEPIDIFVFVPSLLYAFFSAGETTVKGACMTIDCHGINSGIIFETL